MNLFFVDSSVLLDLFLHDRQWFEWSSGAVDEAAELGPLVINPVVLAEVSVRYSTLELLDAALPRDFLRREPIPDAAAFLAGKAFLRYRRRGGPRTTLLPDFLVGAHAAVRRYRLITRDPRRFRDYFPTLQIIAPD